MEKKNSRVSPCFSYLKILKTAFIADTKVCSSGHRRHRRLRYRLHRCSRSDFEMKKEQCKRQNVSQGKKNMDRMLRRGNLPFVRRHL
jgi:hypothetical protein